MRIKIVVFDMDGVLVDIKSSWQFVHDAFNATNQENMKKHLKGEITYSELMRRDIALWGKAHINTIKSILMKAPLMKGAEQTTASLREAGIKTAIISAGISILADSLRHRLELDYAFANKVLTDENGTLTGEGEEVVTLLNKTEILAKLASVENTRPSSCAVVGDSVFDIPLFKLAGFSIAFNAQNQLVRKMADVAVNGKDLTRILPHLIKRRSET